MKAEWDDHNDLCKAHNKTAEGLAATSELVQQLREGLMSFSEAQTEKSAAMSDDAKANAEQLSRISQLMKQSGKETEKKLQEK